MFKAIIDLFRIKPVEDSLLAKKVDSMPQPDRVAEAPSAQAEQIAKAVTTKVAAKKKPRAAKTKK